MKNNNIAIDYLRAFITVLVLAFHSIAAYVSFIPNVTRAFAEKPYLWGPFPVIDKQRWAGFDLFFLFNDTFFMSLMFLLAGLFVWPSIARKGRKQYLRNRFLRLGVPFSVVVLLLSPLAYYPSYLISGADPAVGAYLQQWVSLDYWSPGPCWFLAALLGLDLVAVLIHKYFPIAIETLGKLCARAAKTPLRFFFCFIGVSMMAYLSMRYFFEPIRWFMLGPLIVQASRILLYPTYFFAGVAIGMWGTKRGLLSREGGLVRRWPIWLGATVCAFVTYLFFVIKIKTLGPASPPDLKGFAAIALVVCCGATSFFLLGIFIRFANQRTRIMDSLSANAYGMYLVHYGFVTWTQYALLSANLSAFQKGIAVFVVTLLASWATVAGIRLIPAMSRVLSSSTRLISTSQV